jgi:hypothetical protein
LICLLFNAKPEGGDDQKWLKLGATYQDQDVAISAACLLFNIATDGKALNPGKESGYQ